MGCNIHAFTEYKNKNSDYWQNLGEEFYLNRDYGIFAKLAGVRNYADIPHFKPRGLPKGRLGDITNKAAHLYITDSVCEHCERHWEDRCVSKKQASEYIEKGYAKRVGDSYITDPDQHSHSWLSTAEFESALTEWQAIAKYEISPDYFALLSAMKELEVKGGEVRLVFWFDN